MATETKKTQAKIATLRARAQMRATEEFMVGFTEVKSNQVVERLANLESIWKAFEAAQSKLESLEEDEEQLADLFNQRNEFYNKYCEAKGFLTSNRPCALPAPDEVEPGKIKHVANVRLPKLDLPRFDGNTTDWISFKDRFVSMIDKAEDMPDVVKLQYLLSVLKGEVAKRFQHVQLTADGYSITWKALLDRYDNKRILKREYFRALFSIPPMKNDTIEELRRVSDEFTRLTQGMSALSEALVHWDTPLCNLLFYKLDGKTLLAWEEYTSKDKEDVYVKLQEFLQGRLRILSATAQASTEAQKPSSSKLTSTKQQRGIACVSMAPTPVIRCYACSQPHYLHQCESFKGMQVAQREEVITSNKLCRNCFRIGHIAQRCMSKFKCHKCHQRHHTLLHVDTAMQNPTSDNIVAATTAASGKTTVLLQTALVQVVDDNGRSFDARALLDSGSMSNFISTALANRLSNRKRHASVSIVGIGQRENHIHEAMDVVVSSKTQRFSTKLNFLVIDSPTAQLPTIEVNTKEWRIEGLPLADPFFYKPGQIDLVIGGEAFWAIHTNERISVGSNKPVFVNTRFGWTVAGTTPATTQNRHVSTNAAVSQDTLETTIRRFWELEVLPSSSSVELDEETCEKFFSETTSRNKEGKFVVKLPKVDTSRVSLGDSKAIAEKRFFNTERRLQRNPKMYEEYRKFLKEYEELGHMVVLPEPVDDSMPHCYLPHHPVQKESSTTTKNASSGN
ncbi:uncharacterized protein LOC125768120 [Anopheles funestus]|uniref:uncharacterized protein LOC125768120 n=1 Tax=Anopheles funestus TaxID=62324 RepID=UPI0020C67DA3|nr:uncharacterized protein LOC125768120 [Anopheles funestus]